jgi:hypothetical protein
MTDMQMSAWIEGEYRYKLTRLWDEKLKRLLVLMLNPSTADSNDDDPTLLRCIHFARSWGFGSLEVVNPFALRSPSPAVLKMHRDPIGPRNDDALMVAFGSADAYLFAFGNPPAEKLKARIRHVELWALHRAVTRGVPVYCLGFTKGNYPKHPLARGVHRVPNDQQPILIQPGT